METTHPTEYKQAKDITPGDVILFLGTPHLVDVIEPYVGPFDWPIGIARSSDGWGITLEPTVRVPVA